MLSNFTIEFIQRIEDLTQDLATTRCEAVQARRLGTFRFGRAKPAPPSHSRQHRIQRAWTQAIAMVLQFFQHPLTIDALLGRVVENVHLPEGEEELADDRIAHNEAIVALQIRSRYSITRSGIAMDHVDTAATITGPVTASPADLGLCRSASRQPIRRRSRAWRALANDLAS